MKKSFKIISEKIIPVTGGNVYHFMKKSSLGYEDFGEVYFSDIFFGEFKGWKRHQRHSSNLIVPRGIVEFFVEDEPGSETFSKVTLDANINFNRLFIPPKCWYGFRGMVDEVSLIACVLDGEHDPNESHNCDAANFMIDWRKI